MNHYPLVGGVLRYQSRLCVPNIDNLRTNIIPKAHGSRYSIHQSSTKMYHNLKEIDWWNGINQDISMFVVKYPNCKQVKGEHHKPGGLTQSIDIPTWKC